jgi:orotate phosphoribosyltransferase
MIEGNAEHSFHPEGLTTALEELANLLITTKTIAEVRKRILLPDESYKLIKTSRETNLIDFDPHEGEFAFKLHESNPDAPLAPNYVNWRKMPDAVLDVIGQNLAQINLKSKPDVCTDIPNAGTDLAISYSKHSKIPYVSLFTKISTENGDRIVLKDDSVCNIGNLLIVDNVITKGTSIFQVLKVIQGAKHGALEFLEGIDREEGGSEEIIKLGYNLSCLYKFSNLLNYYLRTDKPNKEKYARSIIYQKESRAR